MPVTSQFEVEDHGDVERLFERALAHGNEGLMLKRKQSTYEYGQRRKSWLEGEKARGHPRHRHDVRPCGQRKAGRLLSDFTLGVSVKEDERYEEEFIPIGKAYGGYTDEEMKELNRKIKEITAERYRSHAGPASRNRHRAGIRRHPGQQSHQGQLYPAAAPVQGHPVGSGTRERRHPQGRGTYVPRKNRA
ncbi:MAG: hypothetical protein U5K31_05420 [Balneolaceae bacterium]|nr:hypothetical protein [Balneolaceae bacterium]